ncbi:MAG: PHP domain-containing protein [Candidatus Eisenbacteria bacterium]|nr:PHP domain-containing protein [Candidatus Eisenbacteria bacterium]
MLREMTADLHIHTCLSPCATLDMTPRRIARIARSRNLEMIAITDHNSAENVAATQRAAAGDTVCVLAGMEITSAEEAHIVALFPTLEAAESMQALVYARLLPGENDEELFGLQVVANEFDEVEDQPRRLLSTATTLEIGELVAEVHARGGLAIAAHIDRQGFSLVGQLGFIPPDAGLDALEISPRTDLTAGRARFPEYADYPMLPASDAHDLDEIGLHPVRLRLGAPSFEELQMALRAREGRGVVAPGVG